MRHALHITEWQALQAICERLSRRPGVVWAGAIDAEPGRGWIAFAGLDECAPLQPDPDQTFRKLYQKDPQFGIVALCPARPQRAFVCGILVPAELSIVAVPDPTKPRDQVLLVEALLDAMRQLRAFLPKGRATHDGTPPPREPPPLPPLHKWDWLPVPRPGRKA